MESEKEPKYYVELVWNREFNWVPHGSGFNVKENAVKYAKSLLEMGDGASVKKVRVINVQTDKVVWPKYL